VPIDSPWSCPGKCSDKKHRDGAFAAIEAVNSSTALARCTRVVGFPTAPRAGAVSCLPECVCVYLSARAYSDHGRVQLYLGQN